MKPFFPLLALGCLHLTHAAQAQSPIRCGNVIVEQARVHNQEQAWQSLRARRQEFIRAGQEELARYPKAALKTTDISPVPVIFHLVLTQYQLNRIGGQAGVAKRVDSQMAALNRDYNAENPDKVSIPAAFLPRYGNTQIRFSLAKRKPDGSPTPGYEIKIIPTGADSTFEIITGTLGSGFACSDAKYSPKGLDAWEVDKYLNVWVVRITYNNSEGVLGLTISPQTAMDPQSPMPLQEEGVVVTYGAFGKKATGSPDYYLPALDQGRTLTHEVGHYFELSHIWADDNGGCNLDDGFSDTPKQASEHYGCPSYPQVSCSNGPSGDMYMNFMDYTDDLCMHMFSQDQANFMNFLTQPGQQSWTLTQNPWLLSVTAPAPIPEFSIAPNPTNGPLYLNFTRQPQQLKSIEILNMMGQQMLQLPVNNSGSYSANLSGLSKGLYFVRCRFAEGAFTQKIVLQ